MPVAFDSISDNSFSLEMTIYTEIMPHYTRLHGKIIVIYETHANFVLKYTYAYGWF